MKMFSILVIREMQINTTVKYHFKPTRMAEITKLTMPNVAEDVEQLEL